MTFNIPPRVSIVMALISFAVALVPALGIVMKSDAVGRAIFAAVWILVGLAWLGQFIHVKRSRSMQ